MQPTHLRVILADDHRVLLEGLSQLLSESGIEVLAHTTDRDELPALIARLQPDVAIVDVSMPGMVIADLIATLRQDDLATPVLVLTGSAPWSLAMDLLAAGAKGYLLKDHAFESLIDAVRAIAGGGTYVSPEVVSEYLKPRPSAAHAVILTGRQQEILALVAEGETSKRIAGRLGIQTKTVEHHRQLIRAKLGARSSAEMVRVAKDHGLF